MGGERRREEESWVVFAVFGVFLMPPAVYGGILRVPLLSLWLCVSVSDSKARQQAESTA